MGNCGNAVFLALPFDDFARIKKHERCLNEFIEIQSTTSFAFALTIAKVN